jgi:peroxiredoxin
MMRFLRSALLVPVLTLFAVACGGGDAKTEATTEAKQTAAKGKSAVNAAPDFTLLGIDGKTYGMRDFKGKVLLLDFWATWCGPCRMELPHLKELHAQYEGKGLSIVGVALDQGGASVVRPFAEKNRIPFVSLLGDETIVKAYGNITAIPTTFLIDRKGIIQKVYRGYQQKSVFEEDIRKLL